MNTIVSPLEHYTNTFKAESYHYRLVNPLTGQVKLGDYSPEQLVKSTRFFRAQNAQGFNVYARPVGYQYVLLDDLTRDVLADVASLKPCMLMETSPGNFQTWLILPETPTDREASKAICHELAVRFGADLASAEPDHVGRLPGYTNRKAKYQNVSGYYPYVTLHRAEHRLSTFYPRGGAVLHTPWDSTPLVPNTRHDHSVSNDSVSEQDFGVACGLVRIGRTDSQIYQHLITTSPDLSIRKGKHIDSYLQRTIRNAHRAVQSYRVHPC